jgi:NAD+ synthase
MADHLQELKIALAQLNPTVGDIEGNLGLLREARRQAERDGADMVIASELVMVGYPPEDLVLRPSLQQAAEDAVKQLALETGRGPALIVGSPWRDEGRLYNAALLLADGAIKAIRFKHDLPNYGVFDEKRVFASGPLPGPIVHRGVRLGLMICEDMWTADVPECLAETGAEILLVINGSPFEADKIEQRSDLARARVRETGLALVYLNQVGGQDELVFDGNSFVLDAHGDPALALPAFAPAVSVCRFVRGDKGLEPDRHNIGPAPERLESIYQALVLGLKDYVGKNRFPGVVLGLSGGIDSALTAAIACDALGPERVHAFLLPSRYTSTASVEDANLCAERLGLALGRIDIEPAVKAFDVMLASQFAGLAPDVTEENIQARVRGITLMAVSNKFGHMVLNTGNKSEFSVGYCTLYGDMAGGFSVLKDVYKTTVYELARWRNRAQPWNGLAAEGPVIPERVLTKAPTAELKPDQTDQDTLPPYPQLDAILEGLVERELSVEQIVASGQPREVVRAVQKMLYTAEYKRRQAAPGVKITRKNFGRDRRYPIVNAFRDRP